jgi:hypothetical protein
MPDPQHETGCGERHLQHSDQCEASPGTLLSRARTRSRSNPCYGVHGVLSPACCAVGPDTRTGAGPQFFRDALRDVLVVWRDGPRTYRVVIFSAQSTGLIKVQFRFLFILTSTALFSPPSPPYLLPVDLAPQSFLTHSRRHCPQNLAWPPPAMVINVGAIISPTSEAPSLPWTHEKTIWPRWFLQNELR